MDDEDLFTSSLKPRKGASSSRASNKTSDKPTEDTTKDPSSSRPASKLNSTYTRPASKLNSTYILPDDSQSPRGRGRDRRASGTPDSGVAGGGEEDDFGLSASKKGGLSPHSQIR